MNRKTFTIYIFLVLLLQSEVKGRNRRDCVCTNFLGCVLKGGKVGPPIRNPCSLFNVCCLLPFSNSRIKSGRSLFRSELIQPKCGISNNAQRKIMGGLDAGYGQFPWTALIKIHSASLSIRPLDKSCGGTLISSKWVLTAGHCTHYCQREYEESDPSDYCYDEIPQIYLEYKVYLGVYDQSDVTEYPPDAYRAIRMVRHPEYRNVVRVHLDGFVESEPRYDVALLLLENDITPHPNVAPICLPDPQSSLYPANHTLATVVGWGRTGSEIGSPHSSILQAVTVPIFQSQDCALLTGLLTFEDQICAGSKNTQASACPGDSGGGLQQMDAQSGKWTLLGIVSNGPSSCGVQPVIYHKVAHTVPWIKSIMSFENNTP